ncbi:hypothetical protein BX666DRAFT_1249484 [Dichotomocladium elegans]|nr:hypothetical protein BX666DRAFT_1249484 [Dichotomocladium elegans]
MSWFWLLLLNRVYQSPILLSIYKICKSILRLTIRTTEIYRICHSAAVQLGWQEDLELEFLSDENREDYPLIEASLPDSETAAAALPEHIVFRIDRSILYSKYLELERRELESISCNLNDVAENIMAKKRFPTTGVQRVYGRTWNMDVRSFASNNSFQ